MEGFVSKKNDFELYAVWNEGLVEVLENTKEKKSVLLFSLHIEMQIQLYFNAVKC